MPAVVQETAAEIGQTSFRNAAGDIQHATQHSIHRFFPSNLVYSWQSQLILMKEGVAVSLIGHPGRLCRFTLTRSLVHVDFVLDTSRLVSISPSSSSVSS